uniref:Uncharacterized protein n=1 Tax=Glossina austeni TaxID=7395 RepID=A0A1A9VVP3_GLOAU
MRLSLSNLLIPIACITFRQLNILRDCTALKNLYFILGHISVAGAITGKGTHSPWDDFGKKLINTASSEESILEYEPDRPRNNSITNVANPQTATQRQSSVLADLIRSREFVMDFPRVFVYNTSSAINRRHRDNRFPGELPERSQSSMSFSNSRDLMPMVTNKLEEQQGLTKVYKIDNKMELQENFLTVKPESVRRRRTRSADGRYASITYNVRKSNPISKETPSMENEKEKMTTNECQIAPVNHKSTHEHVKRCLSGISLNLSNEHTISKRRNSVDSQATLVAEDVADNEGACGSSKDASYVTIQINGEDLD